MANNWFESWFDTTYYHLLYQHRNDQEAQAFMKRLTAHLHLAQGAKIYDIPCGKGRHSLYLANQGYDVKGADLSNSSIQFAQQFEKENLQFFVHDMRESIPFPKADAFLNLFTSFGYFDDEQNILSLKKFKESLLPNAPLVIDFMNCYKVIQNLVSQESKTIEGIQFNLKRFVKDGHIIKTIEVIDQDKKYQFEERVKVLYKEDFEKYLTFAGLKTVEIFGDYQLNSFDPNISDRFIIIAKENVA